MSVFRSLVPFLVYAVLSAFVSDRLAAAGALVLSVALLSLALRAGYKTGALVIDLASVVFFAGYVVLGLIRPDFSAGHWVGAAIQVWLGVIALVTLLVRRPFTLAIAKTKAPERVWHTAAFLTFNMRITGMWVVCFLISGLVAAILAASNHYVTAWIVVLMVVAILIPLVYTRRLTKGLPA